MTITEEYKGTKTSETSCTWHMRPSWEERNSTSYFLSMEKNVDSYLQREKYSISYKIKSSHSANSS